jgi:hypothetical protein
MDTETILKFLGLLGLGTVVNSVINFVLKKFEEKRNIRRQQIEEWRQIVASSTFNRQNFIRHPSYAVLKEHLSESTTKKIERELNEIHIEQTALGVKLFDDVKFINEQISKVEKKWRVGT